MNNRIDDLESTVNKLVDESNQSPNVNQMGGNNMINNNNFPTQ